MVPGPVDHAPQFHLDFLRVPDRVHRASVLEPPVADTVLPGVDLVQFGYLLHVLQCEVGCHVLHGMVGLLEVEHDGVAHQPAVLLRRREALAVLLLLLSPHAVRCPGEVGHDAVARRVAEERGRKPVGGTVLGVEGADGPDALVAVLLHVIDHGVQQQFQVGLGQHLVQEQGVEDDGVALAVAVQVLHDDFVYQSALARPAVVVAHVRRGSQCPHAHLARGIAAQHGAVLNQGHADAAPGCRPRPRGPSPVRSGIGFCSFFFRLCSYRIFLIFLLKMHYPSACKELFL